MHVVLVIQYSHYLYASTIIKRVDVWSPPWALRPAQTTGKQLLTTPVLVECVEVVSTTENQPHPLVCSLTTKIRCSNTLRPFHTTTQHTLQHKTNLIEQSADHTTCCSTKTCTHTHSHKEILRLVVTWRVAIWYSSNIHGRQEMPLDNGCEENDRVDQIMS